MLVLLNQLGGARTLRLYSAEIFRRGEMIISVWQVFLRPMVSCLLPSPAFKVVRVNHYGESLDFLFASITRRFSPLTVVILLLPAPVRGNALSTTLAALVADAVFPVGLFPRESNFRSLRSRFKSPPARVLPRALPRAQLGATSIFTTTAAGASVR